MGVVYRAADLRLARDVAIKVLPPELGYREDLRKRFVREAQFAASLAHPNIIPIHDVGEGGSLVWFVMQFVEGESLRSRVERTGPQSVELTTRILQDVAFGLAYAHARGVVHRDIKPDNIMIERATGRAIVMDFGIAKAVEATGSALTGPGTFIG
ncbi:MAG TPA: serine/threonine-protein kinase, partial [Gemmatimonadales bacterium]|nr:serine/threonine-protein kinase [Gemmatimonadales bacterium]